MPSSFLYDLWRTFFPAYLTPNQRGELQMEAIRTHSKKKVPVIAVDEEELRTHVSEVVRQSVHQKHQTIRQKHQSVCEIGWKKRTP